MATLPTYAQIGIVAAWIVTFCRIAQGISSMGESVGAEIYLTESIELPARYPAVAFVSVSATLGGLFALGVAFFVISFSLNWRFAFWGGAFIAIIGAISRTYLRETPKFLEMKRKWLKKEIHEANLEGDPLYGVEINATWKEPVNGKTLVSYFFVSCGTALCFYLAFIYFNPILKESFGYSSEDIIKHNFFLALVSLISNILVAYLSYQIHPIKINKIRGILSTVVMLSIPFLLINLTNPIQLFLIQVLILIFPLDDVPASAVYMSHFPLYRRFTYATLLFSIARASVYVITAVGVIYLEAYFGSFGLWFITLPAVFGYLCSMRHFEGLERKFKLYPNLSYKQND
jgi:MHS family proline/betaine transporter-like MFS transporter